MQSCIHPYTTDMDAMVIAGEGYHGCQPAEHESALDVLTGVSEEVPAAADFMDVAGKGIHETDVVPEFAGIDERIAPVGDSASTNILGRMVNTFTALVYFALPD
jgi:hypothetical protein